MTKKTPKKPKSKKSNPFLSFIQDSYDGRSKKGTLKAVKDLEKYKPGDVAESLGVSVQKWNAIKKQIKAGKLYNPVLRDSLKGAAAIPEIKSKTEKAQKEIKKLIKDSERSNKKMDSAYKKAEKKLKTKTKKESTPKGEKDSPVARGRSGEYFWRDEKELKKQIPHARTVKTFPDYKQAKEWWKGISGGSFYFVLSARKNKKSGQTSYTVVDIRTERERGQKKGKLNGEARARQLVIDNSEN